MMNDETRPTIDAEAEQATTARKGRETLRVQNALTRTKLRQAEKRAAVLLNALDNIAVTELPEGFRPDDYRLRAGDDGEDRPMLDCVQDYALFILNQGAGVPDRLAVVGYVQNHKVYCMDCTRQRHAGSMEPVYSGVDFVACASCAAGLFVE